MLNDKLAANAGWVAQAKADGERSSGGKPAASKNATCNGNQGDAQVMKACEIAYLSGAPLRARGLSPTMLSGALVSGLPSIATSNPAG